MRLNRTLLMLALALPLSEGVLSDRLAAQDIHFTQFQHVPLAVNPAQAGLYEGTFRISALYRSQWYGSGNSSVKGGYQTPIVNIDVPIKGLRKQDWIGIGVNVFQDKAGTGILTTSLAALSGAYHIGLDNKGTSVFSIGAQYGIGSRRVDFSKLRPADAIISGQPSIDLQNVENNGKSYSDFSLGINYRNVFDVKKKNKFNIGLSVEHLLAPKDNLVKATVSRLPARINVYTSVDVMMTKLFSLHPAIIFRTAGGQSETMAQAMVGLKLDPKKDLVIKAGLGYRLGDAAQVLLGADFGDFRAGLAYDVTVSNLRSSSVGAIKDGFEIAVSYIGKIYKKPNPPTTILCPRY